MDATAKMDKNTVKRLVLSAFNMSCDVYEVIGERDKFYQKPLAKTVTFLSNYLIWMRLRFLLKRQWSIGLDPTLEQSHSITRLQLF